MVLPIRFLAGAFFAGTPGLPEAGPGFLNTSQFEIVWPPGRLPPCCVGQQLLRKQGLELDLQNPEALESLAQLRGSQVHCQHDHVCAVF